MSHPLSVVSLAAILAAPLVAQSEPTVRSHPLAAPVGSFWFNKKGPLWAAESSADPKQVLGGSLLAQRSSTLSMTGTPKLLGLSGSPLAPPKVLVYEEDLGGGSFRYHGLSVRGQWVSTLPGAQGSQYTFLDETFGFQTGSLFYWFNVWDGAWSYLVFSAPSQTFVAGRSALCMIDGTDLIGFSSFQTQSVRLQTGFAGLGYLPGGATSVKQPDRNLLAFATGPNEISVFSAYRNTFAKITTTNLATACPLLYDKNVMTVTDGNTVRFYSALSGGVVSKTFASIANVTLTNEDNGFAYYDATTTEGGAYKATDDSFATVLGAGPTSLLIENDWVAFGIGTKIHAISTVKKGATWQTIDLGTEVELLVRSKANVSNDTVLQIVTDKALYGFSSMDNAWARQPYTGTFQSAKVQDFVSWVLTDTTLWVYTPRGSFWKSIPRTATTTFGDGDSVVQITEGSTRSVFGTDSTAFRAVTRVSGSVESKTDDSFCYSVHDDPSGPGSIVYFYGRQIDRWTTTKTAHRFGTTVPGTEYMEFDDFVALIAPNEILTFSPLGDVASQLSHPNDNIDFHMTTDTPTRFLAIGEPTAQGFWVIGVARTSVALPFGEVLIDLSQPNVVLPIGAFGQDGLAQWSVRMPKSGGRLFAQMARVYGASLALGARSIVEIH